MHTNSTTHTHLLRPLPPVASSPPSPGSAHMAAAPVLLLAPPTLLPAAAAAPTAAASAAAALPPRVVLPTRGLGGLPERARGSSPRGLLCCTATGLLPALAPAAVAAAAATAAAGVVSAGIASGASLPPAAAAAVGSSWGVSSSSGPQLGQLMRFCTVPSGHTRTLVACLCVCVCGGGRQWGRGGGARVVSGVRRITGQGFCAVELRGEREREVNMAQAVTC